MKKRYRQLLLLLSVLVFLVLSPVLVLYAIGYRLPQGTADAKPVGVLIVESLPRRSDIYLNGQYKGRTPNSVTSLPAEAVRLSVAKTGAVTWEKEILIRPGVVTEARDVRLFPENKEITTIATDVTMFSLSPNRNLIAYVSADNRFFVLDKDGIEIGKPLALLTTPDQLLWSPDSNLIIFSTGQQMSMVDITREPFRQQFVPRLNNTTQLAWDQRIPGRLHTVTADQDLISYNLAINSSEVISSDVKLFATSSRHIYLLDLNNQLRVLNLQGALVESPNIEFDQDVKEMDVTPGGRLTVLLEDNSLWYLEDNETLLPLSKGVVRFGWSPDEQLSYLQTDNTSLRVINMFDERLSYVPLNESHLVTRLSRQIRNPQWFAGGRHLIYQVDDEIFITEIDTRDHPANYVVDSTNLGDSNVTVGANGENIYYLKKTGQQNRLVSANLLIDEK